MKRAKKQVVEKTARVSHYYKLTRDAFNVELEEYDIKGYHFSDGVKYIELESKTSQIIIPVDNIKNPIKSNTLWFKYKRDAEYMHKYFSIALKHSMWEEN